MKRLPSFLVKVLWAPTRWLNQRRVKKTDQLYKRIENLHAKNSEVVNSGERILGIENDTNAKIHLARYEFAGKQLSQVKHILDFACGTGYGSQVLAKHLRRSTITGYDRDTEAISYAEKNNQVANVTFTTIEPVGESYDAVIAFEFLEHVPNLQEVFDHLFNIAKEILIVSIPFHEPAGVNPHHIQSNLDESSIKISGPHTFFYQSRSGQIGRVKDDVQNLIIVIKKATPLNA